MPAVAETAQERCITSAAAQALWVPRFAAEDSNPERCPGREFLSLGSGDLLFTSNPDSTTPRADMIRTANANAFALACACAFAFPLTGGCTQTQNATDTDTTGASTETSTEGSSGTGSTSDSSASGSSGMGSTTTATTTTTGSTTEGSTTDAGEDFDAVADDFVCILDWPQVRNYRIHNFLGHQDAAIAIAESADGGEFPVGTVIQLVPSEAMIKRGAGVSPESGDWEFFELKPSESGTEIGVRGFAEVVNKFGGNCLDCHTKAEPQWDFICEKEHGCDPLPFSDEQIAQIQMDDPRCGN